MRGYHIRVVVHRKAEISQSHPHSSSVDTFIPKNLFQHLPSHPPKPTARRNALFNPAHKDYRYGPIRLDWIDFEDMNTAVYTGKEKESRKDDRRFSLLGPVVAEFVPNVRTKSGSTNLPEGTVHLYRDCNGRRLDDADSSPSTSTAIASARETVYEDGIMLGVLAVPSWMTPSDFLAFVAPAAEGMAHLRLIRDSAPNRSVAIIKFRQADEANEFAEAYNGKPFNSMDPETCHVVHVLSVQIDTDDAVSTAISHLGSPQSSMYELPTCPVCLERMDSAVTGLITVPCSHTFHCMCLSKWGDSRCPVCRYSQTLLSSHPPSSTSRSRPIPFSHNTTPALSTCADCSSITNLWICLICGNIGCGRYGRAHAHAHYERTTHLYALELETQRVWDYAGDGYVHRLIQNKADGKLVELPSAASSMGMNSRDDGALGPSHADSLSAEKIEAIGIEYSYLLTSQLDSQRSFYEEQTAELKTQVEELRNLVERLSKDAEKERAEAREQEMLRRKEEEEKINETYRDKIKAEKKAEKLADLARKFEKELKEEKAVSESLLKNLGNMKERAEQAERQKGEFSAQISELQDQVRDVMIFLEARTKIEQGGGAEAEAAGGSVELPVVPPAIGTTNRKKKSKKG
ncbi:BRCA1-associated protein [Leucogyrophana mollusca]|uniref:BRCA1-associated protein n=1 Tax=Leucogyrophana mollusca TaxID=85980 RepID=A0ACB8BT58_9AGAM|nr:BRCA1-associated protein [Leucogyrophana mollusca]